MTAHPERLEDLITEQTNPASRQLDVLSTEDMLEVINTEDRLVALAVSSQIPNIARVVDRVSESLRRGGHVHTFGAGTSGRLGILDASEMHPTFGVDRDLMQGHMAGGHEAFLVPIEGAEDDPLLGAQDVDAAGVTAADVVMALSASGRTPYCLGVLERARVLGAATVAVTCNPESLLQTAADLTIAVDVGPEVLTGSTRMKAGTAQKLVLNMISTGAMVRLGLTFGNLMVGVTPTNLKLRDRARRLVRTITGHNDVDQALEDAAWDVRVASLIILQGRDGADARRHLEASGMSLRAALGR
jgi:N-acetylmuramic acid 6-phosphate etherase